MERISLVNFALLQLIAHSSPGLRQGTQREASLAEQQQHPMDGNNFSIKQSVFLGSTDGKVVDTMEAHFDCQTCCQERRIRYRKIWVVRYKVKPASKCWTQFVVIELINRKFEWVLVYIQVWNLSTRICCMCSYITQRRLSPKLTASILRM